MIPEKTRGGKTMSKKMNMEKLLERQAKVLQDKQRIEIQERDIRKRIADEERRIRTHRLCTRGGMLETYLPDPESISNDTVANLLTELFNLPAAKKIVAEIADQSASTVSSYDSAINQSAEFPEDPYAGFEIEEPEEDE